ncbi:MAG: Crp/Fnr family transcriptional regulator [Blastocatellia bacterium]|nr:Crp/Fnr family transcriptional regulator [Blastocatellia bacterium]
MNDQKTATGNAILDSLPAAELSRLNSSLERIDAPLDFTIYSSYEPITHIYFPINALISLVATTSTGQSAEIGVVGSEGAAGTETLMGADFSPNRSMIQIAGPVYRIGVAKARVEFARCEAFHDSVVSFMHKFAVQVCQTTLCNRLHQVGERLPRWLLMCHDRIDSPHLLLTQEFISLMLGTSRVTVTQTAHQYQSIGLIKYSRGRIKIIDREALEAAACECYHIVKREYDRTPSAGAAIPSSPSI